MKELKDYKNTQTLIEIHSNDEYKLMVPLLNEVLGGWLLEKEYFKNGGYVDMNADLALSYSEIDYKESYLKLQASEFLEQKEQEFILPEKWAVLNTKENIKVLEDWRKHGKGSLSGLNNIHGYLHSDKMWSAKIRRGYTEITFKQFQKYVLKEIPNNSVNIFEIGKWYKNLTTTSYRKCSQTGEVLYYNESIMIDVGRTWENFPGNASWEKVELLTDLTEIQQYLPDGHVDKIQKQPMTVYEFKAGDYIVLLQRENRDNDEDYPYNYCYKQTTNDWYIKSIDAKGRANGWPCYPFDDKCWRYASPLEIAEYNRIGKPYDVNTISYNPCFEINENIQKYDPTTFEEVPSNPTKISIHKPIKRKINVNLVVKPIHTNIVVKLSPKPRVYAKPITIKTFSITV